MTDAELRQQYAILRNNPKFVPTIYELAYFEWGHSRETVERMREQLGVAVERREL